MSEASIGTQWKKGQSGNPKGRPKTPKPLPDQGTTVTYHARWLLDQPCYVMGGGTRQITRQTRFMLDILERAELGELAAIKLLFDLADRGDRRRLQALRAARRAKTADDAAFETRSAERVSPRTPGLRPDQEHAIAYSREPRTVHLKPPKPAKVPQYEVNPYSKRPDEFAHLPKHLTESEREARWLEDMRRSVRDAAARARAGAVASSSQRGGETASTSGPETGLETGPRTGVETGPITGLRNGLRPQQAIDEAAESQIRLGNVEKFVAPPKAGDINGAHVNGHSHAPR